MYAVAFVKPLGDWLNCQIVTCYNKTTLDCLCDALEDGFMGYTVQRSGFLRTYREVKQFHDRCKLLRRPT